MYRHAEAKSLTGKLDSKRTQTSNLLSHANEMSSGVCMCINLQAMSWQALPCFRIQAENDERHFRFESRVHIPPTFRPNRHRRRRVMDHTDTTNGTSRSAACWLWRPTRWHTQFVVCAFECLLVDFFCFSPHHIWAWCSSTSILRIGHSQSPTTENPDIIDWCVEKNSFASHSNTSRAWKNNAYEQLRTQSNCGR